MLTARSLPVMLALALAACGPGTQTPADGGPPPPDPAYWGLADKACFRYGNGAAGQELTLSVIVDTSTVGGVPSTYKLLYRNNGFEQRTDWVGVETKSIVLYRRHVPPVLTDPDKYITYSPAPDLLYQGLKATGMGHTSSTTASISSGAGNSTQMQEFTLNVISTDMVNANGQTVEASQFSVVESVTGGSSSSSKVWFTPQLGIVKLDGFQSASPWVLKQVEQGVAPDDCVP